MKKNSKLRESIVENFNHEERDKIINYVKSQYPDCEIDNYYDSVNELIFYPNPKEELPYSCHVDRSTGEYVIDQDF